MARSEGVSLGGGDCRSSSPVSSHAQCKREEPMRPMEDTGRENADHSWGEHPVQQRSRSTYARLSISPDVLKYTLSFFESTKKSGRKIAPPSGHPVTARRGRERYSNLSHHRRQGVFRVSE